MIRFGRFAAVTLLATALRVAAIAEPTDRIDVETLIQRVLDNDPEIERLRGLVDQTTAQVPLALPPRNPELRLHYARGSDAEVPAPYTERLVETLQEGRSETSGQQTALNRASTEVTTGVPGSTLESERTSARGTGSSQESETVQRTTVRRVTPGRDVQRTEETVTETRRISAITQDTELSASTVQRSTPGSGVVEPLSTVSAREARQGRETSSTRVLRESVEDRYWHRNPYEGSEEYGAELRAFPRNPLELRARNRQARAQVTLAQAELDEAQEAVEFEVRREFLELQALEESLLGKKADAAFRRQELVLNQALFEAGRLGIDEYHLSRVRVLEAEADMDSETSILGRRLDALRSRAGLADHEAIDLSAPWGPSLEGMEALDPDRLLPVAMERSYLLEQITLDRRHAQAERAANRAARLPWPSMVSLSYQVDEQYGDKVGDEFQVLAGIELPLVGWFSGAPWRPQEAYLESLDRQERKLARLLDRNLRQAVERARDSMERATRLASQRRSLEDDIRVRMEAMQDTDLATRRQKLAMARMLLLVQDRERQARLETALDVLALQAYLGPGFMERPGDGSNVQPDPLP